MRFLIQAEQLVGTVVSEGKRKLLSLCGYVSSRVVGFDLFYLQP